MTGNKAESETLGNKVHTAVGDVFTISSKHTNRGGGYVLDRFKIVNGKMQDRSYYTLTDPIVIVEKNPDIKNVYDITMENGSQRMTVTNVVGPDNNNYCAIKIFDVSSLAHEEDRYSIGFNVSSQSETVKWIESFLDGKISLKELEEEGTKENFNTRSGRARILNTLVTEPVGSRWSKKL